jgi:ubiquinone/menaquinone biosynthesis C-methylase UbiE
MKHLNYFESQRSADLYLQGRPDFHEKSIKLIRKYLNLEKPVAKALDIACGTGLSTQALLPIANKVYGTDSSVAMLNNAPHKDRIHYHQATADKQPFEDDFFDLITVCSGIHWFDIDSFLVEANRILKPQAWLVLYDNFFLSHMEKDPSFKDWHQQVYLHKFPAPARNDKYDWSDTNLNTKRFEPTHEETFTNTVAFSQKDLLRYLMSQSNTISVIEKGDTTDEIVREWIIAELASFFPEPDHKHFFTFGNWILYLHNIK